MKTPTIIWKKIRPSKRSSCHEYCTTDQRLDCRMLMPDAKFIYVNDTIMCRPVLGQSGECNSCCYAFDAGQFLQKSFGVKERSQFELGIGGFTEVATNLSRQTGSWWCARRNYGCTSAADHTRAFRPQQRSALCHWSCTEFNGSEARAICRRLLAVGFLCLGGYKAELQGLKMYKP